MLRETGGVGLLLEHRDALDLDETQRENLDELRVPFKVETIDKTQELQKVELGIRDVMRDHGSSESDVLAAIDKLSSCQVGLREMRNHHRKAALQY